MAATATIKKCAEVICTCPVTTSQGKMLLFGVGHRHQANKSPGSGGGHLVNTVCHAVGNGQRGVGDGNGRDGGCGWVEGDVRWG